MINNQNRSFSKIILKIEDGVFEIELHNPPANVLDGEMIRELKTALDLANRNNDIDEIYIKGSGDFFSAGADVKNELKTLMEFPRKKRSTYACEFSKNGHDLIMLLTDIEKPIIAFIDGYAFGGGLELALGCHYIVATQRSIMGLPELTLGIIPGWGGTVLFPVKLGVNRQTGFQFIREGKLLNAKEAFSYGLIDELALGEKNELKLPAPKPVSSSISKLVEFSETLSGEKKETLNEALSREANLFALACCHPDAEEGINAFLERREAKFINGF